MFNVNTMFESDTYYTFDKSSSDIYLSDTKKANREKYMTIAPFINRRDGLDTAFWLHGLKNVTLDFMKDNDITAIFANIMDNAIEACEEVEENKSLSINISQVNKFVYIDLINSYSGKILKPNDRFITIKKDHMGYGMISIQRTLEKYNGYMNTEQTDKEFIINIVIPVQ